METKANHVLIGLFTMAVIIAVFGFILWVARFDQFAGRQPVLIVFDSAVTGLAPGASVLFNGIKVGEVADLAIDNDNPQLVRALVRVESSVPLKEDTTARLESQGLTGAVALQLSGGSTQSPPIEDRSREGYPVIFAEKSQFQDLIDSLRAIAANGAVLFDRLDVLIAQNQDAISRTVTNIESFSEALAESSKRIDKLMVEATDAATGVRRVSERLETLVARTEDRGLREVETFASEGRSTLRNIQRVMERLESNPRRFFFGKSQVPEYNPR